MKKIFLIALITFIMLEVVFAQKNDSDSTLVKYFRLDFAIPDQPAFKILGTSPSDILRPSNSNELTTISSSFMEGNSIVIPKAFSMEVAPMFLAKSNNLTLKDYRDQKFLYRTKISIGTQQNKIDTINYYKLAVGLRFTIFDKGDLKDDTNYLNELFEYTADKTKLENIYKLDFLAENKITMAQFISSEDYQKDFEEYKEKRLDEDFKSNLEKIKETYKLKKWNADKLELAIAFLTESPDSLAKNIQFAGIGLWSTYAKGVKDWGQFLLGASYNYVNFDSLDVATNNINNYNNHKLSAALRLYLGNNNYKGFFEGQANYASLPNSLNALINLGAELNISDGLWVNFNAGYLFTDITGKSSSDLFTGFDFRFQIPENLKSMFK